MKTISVRELRGEVPRLKETLAKEHELLLLSNGEPVARILPVHKKRYVSSLAAHRARMPMIDSLEAFIREERDRR